MCECTRAHALPTNVREPMCKPCIYTQWRRSLSWLVGPFSTRPLSSVAKALSGDSGQAALDEKKRHDLALEKYQRDYAQYQKDRTQLLDWVASGQPTEHWPSTTKHTEQR